MTLFNRTNRVVAVVLLVGMFTGCAHPTAHFGFRPDEPAMKNQSSCDEYRTYVDYVQGLQEAYHSRASQNRWWIYIAGLTGIGVVAASGGLALAGAAGVTTLGLLSISGGTAASAVATISNDVLAGNYTIAASDLDQALAAARRTSDGTVPPPTAAATEALTACHTALAALTQAVSGVRRTLETNRTSAAAAALHNALHESKVLDETLKKAGYKK